MPDTEHRLVIVRELGSNRCTTNHAIVKVADGEEPWFDRRAKTLRDTVADHFGNNGRIEVVSQDELAAGLVIRVASSHDWPVTERCLSGALQQHHSWYLLSTARQHLALTSH